MNVHQLAAAFVDARRSATGLTDYPGPLPADLDQAYAIQDAAIELWGEDPVGWKAGLITPQLRTPGGDERLIGPIWAGSVHRVGAVAAGDADDPNDAEVSDAADRTDETGRAGRADRANSTDRADRTDSEERPGRAVAMPVYADGFAAVEAEFVVQILSVAPPGTWTAEQVAELGYEVSAGIEIASSPLTSINDLGPAVTASDFGNNAGLVVGPRVPSRLDPAMITVRTEIDGQVAGEATGAAVPGGILTSVAQTLTILGRRGRAAPAGTVFATGAVTGVHRAGVGSSAVINFGDLPALRCELVAARPQ